MTLYVQMYARCNYRLAWPNVNVKDASLTD